MEVVCESHSEVHTPVWMTTSAIHNNPRSYVQRAGYVLMFVCMASQGKGRIVPKIAMFHENIRMETHFTVKAGFVIALKEPRLVCSIRAPSFALFHFCILNVLSVLCYAGLCSCQVMFVTKEWRVFLFFSVWEVLLLLWWWWWLNYSHHRLCECWSGVSLVNKVWLCGDDIHRKLICLTNQWVSHSVLWIHRRFVCSWQQSQESLV